MEGPGHGPGAALGRGRRALSPCQDQGVPPPQPQWWSFGQEFRTGLSGADFVLRGGHGHSSGTVPSWEGGREAEEDFSSSGLCQ